MTRRTRSGPLRWIAALACALAATSMAFAQGVPRILPEPISSRQLSQCAEILGLSPQQRLALEAAHQEYQEEFRRLQEQEIDPFMRDAGNLGRRMRFLSNPKETEAALDGYEKLLARVKAVDERLLTAMQSVLTEEQLTALPRVRQWRERERYGAGITRMVQRSNPAAVIDLSEILRDLELAAPGEAEAAAIRQYESNLTTATRKLHDLTLETFRDFFKQMEALNQDAPDPQNPGRFFETMTPILGQLFVKVNAHLDEMAQLNRRSLRGFESVLAEDLARPLRDRFYRQGYSDAGSGDNPALLAMQKALDLSNLDATTREAVLQLRGGLRATTDRLTDQAATVIDQRRLAQRPFEFRGPGAEDQAFVRDLDDLRQKRRSANESALASLRGLLGPELFAQVEPPAGGGAAAAGVALAPAPAGGGGGGAPAAPGPRPESETDPFLPGPIGGSEVERLSAALGFDESQREIGAALHEDYIETYGAVRRARSTALVQARALLEERQPDAAPPAPEDVARLYQLRRSALDELAAIDRALLESLSAIAGAAPPAAMERFELARRRDVYRAGLAAPSSAGMPGGRQPRGGFNPFGGARSGEASIDLSRLASEDAPIAAGSEADRVMLEYERAATEIFRTAWESNLRVREQMERLGIEMMNRVRQRDAGGGGAAFGAGFQSLEEGDGRALREATRQIVQLNRQALQQLEPLLDAAAHTSLERAYQRKAFPDIFNDDQAPGVRLDAALALSDLTPQQRGALGQVGAEFRSAYEGLLQQMVSLRMADEPGGADRFQRGMEQWRQMDRLRSERDDLGHRLLLRLRALLTEEQATRIALPLDAQ
jgi:hypothetical protein